MPSVFFLVDPSGLPSRFELHHVQMSVALRRLHPHLLESECVARALGTDLRECQEAYAAKWFDLAHPSRPAPAL